VESSEAEATVPIAEPSARRDWLLLGLGSIGKAGLYGLGSFVLWALVPLLFGLTVTTVASGSMEPGIRTGDVVAALPVAETELRVGQILLFKDPAVPDRLKLHRAVEQSEEGITTQGDANPEPDSMLLAPSAVVGVGFVRVPWIGVPLNWFHQGDWLRFGLFAGALGGLALLSGVDSELRRRDREARGASHRAVDSAAVAQRSRLKRTGLTLMAALLTAVLAVYLIGSAASAAFSSQTASGPSSFTAAEFFKTPWERASFHWAYSETLLGLNLGAAVDDTGNGRNGSLTGIITRPSEGGNPYVYLDGLTAQIYSARVAGPAPSSFTVETWFRTRTTAGGKLMGYGNSQTGASSTADRHLYMANSGRLHFGLLQNGQRMTVSSPASYNDDRWHLAVATVSETEGTALYVDGVLVGSSPSMISGSTVSDGYWRVGYDSIDAGWPESPFSGRYSGSLDGTALYPYALSGSAVAAHYSYGR